MSLDKELDKLADSYTAADGENAAEVIAALQKHHATVEKDAAARGPFYAKAASICGGAYIPYLFWTALARFYDDETAREDLGALLKAFSVSDFEEDLQQKMKSLIVVYYAKESSFELAKVHARMSQDLHPTVKEFFDKMKAFAETNKVAVQTYCDKFALLRHSFANFQLLALPLSKLEEQLG